MTETEQLRLILKEAKIIKLTGYPGVDGSSQVLNIRALLTRPLADQLKCRSLCFGDNNMPRRFDAVKLTEEIEGCEIVFAAGSWIANKVNKFKIGHPKEATETDPSLEVQCNLHFDAHVPLWDFLVHQNKAAFEVSLKPPVTWKAQGELAFDRSDEEDSDDDDKADGFNTKADSDGDCAACDQGIALVPGLLVHENDAPCTLRRTATSTTTDEPVGPALASAREVGVGTHQKGTRGRRPRNRALEAEADGTAPLGDVQPPVTDTVQ